MSLKQLDRVRIVIHHNSASSYGVGCRRQFSTFFDLLGSNPTRGQHLIFFMRRLG